MSDPREHDDTTAAQPAPPSEQRKGVSPLIWIVLLLALLALGWWFYNRSVQSGIDTTAPAVTTEPVIGSEQDTAAQAERERAAANEARRAEREREAAAAAAAKKVPADRAVEPVARVQPEYPADAARSQEEGTVLVRVEVDANGTPTDVSVAKRSGSRELDRAALDAVRKWRFQPAIKNGRAVASVAEVPVDFNLANR
jgi:protein TonB